MEYLIKRPANERFHTKIGWLNGYHTFSFGRHYDPEWIGFSDLLVINDDTVAPASGFDTHPHRDMEIITYVTEGVVAHKDSMGNKTQIKAGEVQRMRAGTGVAHSEMNPSQNQDLKLLQIWLPPHTNGLAPDYAQRPFSVAEKTGKWCPVVTPDGRDNSLQIAQDASMFARFLAPNESADLPIGKGRSGWLHVVCGTVQLGDMTLTDGDGVGIIRNDNLTLTCSDDAEVILFDLRPVDEA